MLSFNLGATAAPPANPAISELQTALIGLAQASGDPRLNPGPVTGALSDATMIALSIGLAIAIRKTADQSVPSEIVTMLQYTALTDEARKRVTEYATTLTKLLRAATIAYTTGAVQSGLPTGATTPAGMPTIRLDLLPRPRRLPGANTGPGAGAGANTGAGAAAPKWYTTWWGIGGIIVLGGLAVLVFDRTSEA